MKNVQFWSESLRAMLEYWDIEHGLLSVLQNEYTQHQIMQTSVPKSWGKYTKFIDISTSWKMNVTNLQ